MRAKLGALALAALLAVALAAQAPPAAGQEPASRPFSEAEFIHLLQVKTPPEEVLAQIHARGIQFAVTPEFEEKLKILKADKRILAALTEPATLQVRSNAPGAELTLDGQPKGTTSADGAATLSGLAPGSHSVKLRAEGRVAAAADVFLKPGETGSVTLELLEAVTAAPGPLGIQVSVQAGTAEDSALVQLEFEKEPAKRIALLQQLLQKHGQSPLALLAYSMLQESYLSDEQFDPSIAAGQELLKRDPKNFAAQLRCARAYLGKGQVESAFDATAEAVKLVEALRTAPLPAGKSPESWESQRRQLLEAAASDLDSLSYTLLLASTQLRDPARKGALLERFLQMFPQSAYRGLAFVQLAYAAQQRNDAAATVAWGDRALELNPNEPAMLVLVPDILSEAGKDLDRARTLVTYLLDLIANQPDKIRPPGLDDAQWAAQKQLWEGLAHSVVGYVLLYQEKTPEAIKEFRAAAPLLKPDALLYARNQFRLGFAYAKLGDLVPARDALNEAVAADTPYRPLARDLLKKVQDKLAKRGGR